MKLNANYLDLKQSYLFAETAKRAMEYKGALPLIKMGIGDVTLPLASSVVEAMKQASDEMGKKETFRGYGPYQGYDFLREKIKSYYLEKKVELDINEIFVSDGAKSDVANFLDLFDKDNEVVITTPVYPVYVDTNIMCGRKITMLDGNEGNGYLPMPNKGLKADLIYLCSPNNPTGAVYNRKQLKEWVDFAKENNSLILFDSAYEAFVSDSNYPTSIFEIEGAKEVAVEFCSFSKTAGFTGTRCGYTIVPNAIATDKQSLNQMWVRRQTTKFNGVSYVVQRGAEAIFTKCGRAEIKAAIDYYKKNAAAICQTMKNNGMWFCGGVHSPYVWFKVPTGYTSWEYFDYLLNEKGIVGTPGVGFGESGEGYFRFSSFNSYENTLEAMKRLSK